MTGNLNVQVSDTTKDAICTEVGYKKVLSFIDRHSNRAAKKCPDLVGKAQVVNMI